MKPFQTKGSMYNSGEAEENVVLGEASAKSVEPEQTLCVGQQGKKGRQDSDLGGGVYSDGT